MNSFLRNYLRWTVLSAFIGLIAGICAAVFLISLEWVTNTRDLNPILIWGLPFAGFTIGYMYHRYGRDISAGTNLILDEIHDPKKVIPVSMGPMILVSTLLTHLFGGSVGREGTAVQMSASFADQLSRVFKINGEERKFLLAAGAGAGFGAAIGAPWAGFIFGMEMIHVGRFKPFAWFQSLIASFVGYYTAIFIGAHHTEYGLISAPAFDLKLLFFVAVAGVIFGGAARLFMFMTHLIEKVQQKFVTYPPLKPFFAGLLLVVLYYAEGSYRYVGLGIPVIQQALHNPALFTDPIFKTIFTSLTIGSGFKGGEFIPLVFIGTTLGSALSFLLPISFKILAAVGFAAVFAGASNTPIACTLMAIEIFGLPIAPYAFVACFMSYYCSGLKGIYKSQKIIHKKFFNIF
ncbi:MAG: chloride channel protein [Bdellovibrio sp.]|nr:chloride channel protein [Bdellovibrio sp.]